MSFIVIVITLVSLYTRLSAHQIVHNRRARFSQEKQKKSTIMVAFGRGSQTAPGVVLALYQPNGSMLLCSFEEAPKKPREGRIENERSKYWLPQLLRLECWALPELPSLCGQKRKAGGGGAATEADRGIADRRADPP